MIKNIHTPKIRVQGLTKSFGAKEVLCGIDLEVASGESLVVIGGSGTGKSVLLKCMLGLIEADSGVVEIDGQEMVGSDATTRQQTLKKMSMLFQGSALFDSLPVWENVVFRLLQEGSCDRKQGRSIAIEKLAAVGMGERVADLFPVELSGGMQRRVALARAIANDPEIIFFDEPTTGLDPIVATIINELIVKCVKELGATAITITHDMVSAKTVGHRIAMLHGGKIIWSGSPQEITNSNNEYVDQFIHGKAQGPIRMV